MAHDKGDKRAKARGWGIKTMERKVCEGESDGHLEKLIVAKEAEK